MIGFRTYLVEMTDEMLKTNIQAVTEKLTEKPKNLNQETGNHWEEIKNGTYLFLRKHQLANYLKTISLTDCMNFFDEYICPPLSLPTTTPSSSLNTRKKICSQFFGKGTKYPKNDSAGCTKGVEVVLIDNPNEFKRKMMLLPVVSFDM